MEPLPKGLVFYETTLYLPLHNWKSHVVAVPPQNSHRILSPLVVMQHDRWNPLTYLKGSYYRKYQMVFYDLISYPSHSCTRYIIRCILALDPRVMYQLGKSSTSWREVLKGLSLNSLSLLVKVGRVFLTLTFLWPPSPQHLGFKQGCWKWSCQRPCQLHGVFHTCQHCLTRHSRFRFTHHCPRSPLTPSVLTHSTLAICHEYQGLVPTRRVLQILYLTFFEI